MFFLKITIESQYCDRLVTIIPIKGTNGLKFLVQMDGHNCRILAYLQEIKIIKSLNDCEIKNISLSLQSEKIAGWSSGSSLGS